MSGAIGALVGLIFALIILGAIWWGIQQLLPLISLAEPFATIVRVLLTIIMVLIVLWVIIVLLGIAGVRVPNPFSGVIPSRSFAAISTWAAEHMPRVLT